VTSGSQPRDSDQLPKIQKNFSLFNFFSGAKYRDSLIKKIKK